MTKVTYTYINYGVAIRSNIKSLAEVQAMVEKNGGHYKAVYTPIPRPIQKMTSARKEAYLNKYGMAFA